MTFVVGLIVFLPFPSWQQLVGFITSATVLSFGSGPLVLAAMRRQMPDRERPFRVPFGDVIPFLAFYASNLIVYWAGWDGELEAVRRRRASASSCSRSSSSTGRGDTPRDGLARRARPGRCRGWPGCA